MKLAPGGPACDGVASYICVQDQKNLTVCQDSFPDPFRRKHRTLPRHQRQMEIQNTKNKKQDKKPKTKNHIIPHIVSKPPQPSSPDLKSPISNFESEVTLIPAPPKTTARAMSTLWRDLILSVWRTDPLKCPCCQGIIRRVETIVRPGEVEFFLRLLGLWEGLISLPPPPDPPYDIEERSGIGGVLDAGESRSPQGEPAKWGGRIKPSSPSNHFGRPSVPGFQPAMTDPQPTCPNSGTKAPAQVGKPRKSISETDALPSSNTPDDQGHRLGATRRNYLKTRCQKIPWQGGRAWHAQVSSEFAMNQAETPCQRPNSDVWNRSLLAVHHSGATANSCLFSC